MKLLMQCTCIFYQHPEDNNRNRSPKYGHVGQRIRNSMAESVRHVLLWLLEAQKVGATSSIVRHMHIICNHSSPRLEAERQHPRSVCQ